MNIKCPLINLIYNTSMKPLYHSDAILSNHKHKLFPVNQKVKINKQKNRIVSKIKINLSKLRKLTNKVLKILIKLLKIVKSNQR
jgi:hypothetical protein